MNKSNYFFLSGLFFVVFLVVEFTDIYGDSGWFKAFLLFSSATFLMSGIAGKMKKNNDSDQLENRMPNRQQPYSKKVGSVVH